MPSVQTMLRMTYMPPEIPMPAISAPIRKKGENMRSVETVSCSGSPTSDGTAGYPTSIHCEKGSIAPCADIYAILKTITTTSGMQNSTIKRLTMTSFENLPLNISQKSAQRLVGSVLLAYSSSRSLPSSILAIKPFFSP